MFGVFNQTGQQKGSLMFSRHSNSGLRVDAEYLSAQSTRSSTTTARQATARTSTPPVRPTTKSYEARSN
jgi:hypothetical protein